MTNAPIPQAAASDALPATLGGGRFEVRRHLGTGGMGVVYEAIDHDKGARVALKTLTAFDPGSLLHLKNEFRSLQGVRHPNLVSLFEFFEDCGRWFIAMELVEGVSLLAHVRPGWRSPVPSGASETRRVPLAIGGAPLGAGADTLADPTSASGDLPRGGACRDPSELHVDRLRAALAQLAQGLCALHESGKVHRDVKPSNILVESGGRVVLVDFGLAVDVDGASASRPDGAGTRAYMAPEQAAGESVSPASDWYSVGVVLYEALTGTLPFRGADAARRRAVGVKVPASTHAPSAPEDLSALCDGLLEVDPHARLTGSELLRRLGATSLPEPARRVSFVGRSTEDAALGRALEDSRRRPVLVVVRGESGVGKSALVREFVTGPKVRDAGALVLSGGCYEREVVPYKAFDGIVDALGDFLRGVDPSTRAHVLPPDAAALARVFPVLGRIEGFDGRDEAAPVDPQEQQARAFAVLRAVLGSLARERPLVLAIDDVQWADADSHRLLDDLLRPPRAPAICIVMTARPGSPGPDIFDDLAQRFEDVRLVELRSLPLEDARRLTRAVLGPSGDDGEIESIARETGGHPLFILTLALALAGHSAQKGATRARELRLDDALWARFERVEPEAKRVLQLVAVAGAPLGAETLARAAALDRATYDSSVRALQSEHLVRSSRGVGRDMIEPYHDRVRESVVSRIAPIEIQTCHRRLAGALATTSRSAHDAASLVRHLEGAGETEQAARQAEIAAHQAEDALAFDRAAEMIRCAVRLGRHAPGALQALRERLAETLANAGRAADAAQACLDAEAGASPAKRLELRRRAADHWLRSGHIDRGIEILSTVLREIGDHLPTQRAAVIATVAGRLRARLRGLGWTRTPEAQIPVSTLQRIDAYHAIGVSLALIDPARGGVFEGRALRLALDAGEPHRLAATLAMEAGYCASAGARGLARARRLLQELARIDASGGDGYAGCLSPMMDGFVDYHAGQFYRSATSLRDVERRLRAQPGAYFERAFCHCFRLIALRYGGRIGELDRGFSEWVRDAERRGDRFSEAAIRFNLNSVWLARGAPDEARADLRRTRWAPPQGGYHMQHWYEQHARFEIELYEGAGPQTLADFRPIVATLSRSLVLRMRIHRVHVHWLLGRLLLATASVNGDVRALREAESVSRRLDREDVPYARTYALLLQSAVEHRRGRDVECARLLDRAAAHADEHDYPHCASAARLRLASIVGGSRGAALEQQARAWMSEQGIRDPERMSRVWSPGFEGGC